MRFAIVRNADSRDHIDAYLPDNYRVVAELTDHKFLIQGEDQAGWTMEDYVIPRAASGLIWIKEIKEGEVEVINNIGFGVVFGSLAEFTVFGVRSVTVTNLSFDGNQAMVNGIPVDYRFTFIVKDAEPWWDTKAASKIYCRNSGGQWVIPDAEFAYRTDKGNGFYSNKSTDNQRRKLKNLLSRMVAKLPARAYLAGQNIQIEHEINAKSREVEELENDIYDLKREIRRLQMQLEAGLMA